MMIIRQISYRQAAQVLGYSGPDLAHRLLFKWYIEYLGGEAYRIRGCMGGTTLGIARTLAMALPALRKVWTGRQTEIGAMDGEMCSALIWPEGIEARRLRKMGLIG